MTSDPPPPRPVEQGHGPQRLPLPAAEALDPAQRAAAQALIEGPRGAVYGPFVPLLRTPALLERVAQLGEALRYGGRLDARVRELAICLAARAVGNQFEWVMHAPLARAAGVAAAAIDAIAAGAHPQGLAADEQVACDFATELLQQHGVCDATYARALAAFGEPGVVELATLVGYFVMVSWVMNVARTPSLPTAQVAPLRFGPP
jgi:4-carboxymuconolactone decarboxylase